MKKAPMSGVMRAIQGDITTLSVDAIVNAANSTLLGGGGVDGAIHRAAGQQLLQACRRLQGCHTGDAKATPGFNLSARYIIHTVGPVWHGGQQQEPELLASCYRRSLSVAQTLQVESIAFPCISTGVYGYPVELAASIAITTVAKYLQVAEGLRDVIFCCFSRADLEVYQRLLV